MDQYFIEQDIRFSHNEVYSKQEQLEDAEDKVDAEHTLYADDVEDVENTQFAEVVRSMPFDFEVFEEGYEDQKSSFAKAGLDGH